VHDQTILDWITRLGLPTVILIVFLTQLSPKIDRGLQIADHVDAELQYLAIRGCAPPTNSGRLDFRESTSSGLTDLENLSH
jgi:hypothetical protein